MALSSRAKGVLCILASAFGFALMAFFVRLCDDFGGPISCFQKSFFRNAVALVVATAMLVAERRRARGFASDWTSRTVSLLLARSVFGCVGIFANFYALSHIPIGEAMALNKTAPFFTVVFAWLLMGERVSWRQFLALVVALGGVMLVMQPGFRGAETWATCCALAGGLGAGVAYVCVHRLGQLKVDGALIVVFFSAFSCLSSLPLTALDYRPMTFAQVMILIGAGTGAAIGQFGVTAAYRFAEPRAIAVFDYSNVIFTALFGYLFFAQTPDLLSVAGFAAILLAAFVVGHSPPLRGAE